MISLSYATRLQKAGLVWEPMLHDFFAIPIPELEDRIFVVSDMTIDIRQYLGRQTITFNGAMEWSLDYILKSDVVWMPTEEQLRQAILAQIVGHDRPKVLLSDAAEGICCQIKVKGEMHRFTAREASDAYAQALLFLLETKCD